MLKQLWGVAKKTRGCGAHRGEPTKAHGHTRADATAMGLTDPGVAWHGAPTRSDTGQTIQGNRAPLRQNETGRKKRLPRPNELNVAED
eukprot:2895143-Lingulodinium_polyedra.AAC.1